MEDSEPPKTPPNKVPTPSTPPIPRGRSPRVRAPYDCGNRDKLGPQYWEYHDKTPNFAVSPLKGGDFKERLSVIEWADKLGYKYAHLHPIPSFHRLTYYEGCHLASLRWLVGLIYPS